MVGFWSFKVWQVLLATYTVISLGATLLTAKKRNWGLLPVLPIVFAVFHFSYGLGFLTGLVYWPLKAASRPSGEAFYRDYR